jgi:hypothetical protein
MTPLLRIEVFSPFFRMNNEGFDHKGIPPAEKV